MGFAWAPIGILDLGVDGTIELCDPVSGVSLHQIIRVQSKATSARFRNETADTFRFTCTSRDLDYWLAGSVPVILVCSRVSTREAYWVSLKDYFADPARRETRTVVFEKEYQRFDVAAAPELLALVGVRALPKRASTKAPHVSIRKGLDESDIPIDTNELDMLPPNTMRAVTDVMRALDAAAASDESGPPIHALRNRSRLQLSRQLSAHAAIRTRLTTDAVHVSRSTRLVFARLLMFQQDIAVWTGYVLRALEQHLAPLPNERRENEGYRSDSTAALLDQLVAQYTLLITGRTQQLPFITVTDVVESVQSHRVGIVLVPSTFVTDLSTHIAEIWHEVGAQVFFLRYGAEWSPNVSPTGPESDPDAVALSEVADVYGDLLLIRHVFEFDLEAFIAWRAWAMMNNAAVRQAPPALESEYLARLLARCYFAAESRIRALLITSSRDHQEVETWLPSRVVVAQTIEHIAACVSRTVLDDRPIPAETLAVAAHTVYESDLFLRRCMVDLQRVESAADIERPAIVVRYAHLQMTALRTCTAI